MSSVDHHELLHTLVELSVTVLPLALFALSHQSQLHLFVVDLIASCLCELPVDVLTNDLFVLFPLRGYLGSSLSELCPP